jgi:hypothetical protein
VNHQYHESKFEAKTCAVLHQYFDNKNVLIPHQHRLKTKFDFIIPEITVVEPHAIWSNVYGNANYFDYYQNRRQLAEKEKLTKNLPMLVLASESDLSLMKRNLRGTKDPKEAISDTIVELLEKYKTPEVIKIEKINYLDLFVNYKWLGLFMLSGWILAILLALMLLLS